MNDDYEPHTRSERLAAQQRRKSTAKSVSHPHKRHHLGRWLLAGLALIGVMVGLFFTYAYHTTKEAVDRTYKSAHIKKARDVEQVLKDGKPVSILLLGTDTGELGRNYKGRTDSIMLATINPQKKQTTLVSIPRDTLVAPVGFEDKFPAKLNSAYEDGSAATTIQTIQDWLNVPVDYYALVNMGGLEKVVDRVDGVKVKSPLTFAYNPDTAHADPGNLYRFVEGSYQYTHTGEDGVSHTYSKMDGKAALAFSRMRYDDPRGDYGRQERQRLVLEAILNKVKANPATLLSEKFLDVMSKSAQTDLRYGDLWSIAKNYGGALGSIKTDHVQGTSYNLTSGSTEVVSASEQQRITDKIRSQLGLSHKESGNLYGGEVSTAQMLQAGVPLPNEVETTTTETQATNQYGTTAVAPSVGSLQGATTTMPGY